MHFIWTQFSLRIPKYEKTVRISDPVREKWFAYRADIFNRGLLACIRSQTVRPAGVILLMDTGDHELFTKYIDDDDLIMPIFQTHERARFAASDAIKAVAENRVLITRVDSDDLISSNFVEDIGRRMSAVSTNEDGQAFCVTTTGFRSDLRIIQSFDFRASPFITSCFEGARDQPLLAPVGNHMRVLDRNPAFCKSACWVQLVHGSNVANGFLHRVRVRKVDTETWPQNVVRPDLRDALSNNPIAHVRAAASFSENLKAKFRLMLLSSDLGTRAVRFLRRGKS